MWEIRTKDVPLSKLLSKDYAKSVSERIMNGEKMNVERYVSTSRNKQLTLLQLIMTKLRKLSTLLTRNAVGGNDNLGRCITDVWQYLIQDQTEQDPLYVAMILASAPTIVSKDGQPFIKQELLEARNCHGYSAIGGKCHRFRYEYARSRICIKVFSHQQTH